VRRSLAERFWEKVDKSGECWEWTGCKNQHGYGRINNHGYPEYAHRVAWLLQYGAFPAGHLLHSCDNPACVWHEHLHEGTHTDNMRDMTVKGRNRARKLSPEAVIDILTSHAPHSELAAKHGVTRQAVAYRRKALWTHVQ
jgi:hypothetical protein